MNSLVITKQKQFLTIHTISVGAWLTDTILTSIIILFLRTPSQKMDFIRYFKNLTANRVIHQSATFDHIRLIHITAVKNNFIMQL